MKNLFALAIMSCACFTFACGGSASVPPPDLGVGDDQAPCESACSTEQAVGCLGPGRFLTCVSECQAANTLGLVDPACVAQAATWQEMEWCGVPCASAEGDGGVTIKPL